MLGGDGSWEALPPEADPLPTTTPICTRSSARGVSTVRHRTDFSACIRYTASSTAGKPSDDPLHKGETQGPSAQMQQLHMTHNV